MIMIYDFSFDYDLSKLRFFYKYLGQRLSSSLKIECWQLGSFNNSVPFFEELI